MGIGSMGTFMSDSKTLLDNAQKYPDLLATLTTYGYDRTKLEAGSRLWTTADTLIGTQAKEYGEQYAATQELEKAWERAGAAYVKTYKVARVAFGNDAKAVALLKLGGARKQTLEGWFEQARPLYRNLLDDAALRAVMEPFGFTAKRLADELSLVDAVMDKNKAKKNETGEAQQATVARDAAIRTLDDWMSDFRAICRVAFADEPQSLERLGILVLSAPRRKKAAEPVAESK